MREVSAIVEIQATASGVWAVLEDVRRLPELSDSTIEVRDAPARLTTPGQTFCQVVEVAGRRVEAAWTLAELTPGHRIVIEGSAPFRGRFRLVQEVESLGSRRCRVSISIGYSLPFGPLGRLVARLGAERRATEEARSVLLNLQRLLEGHVTTTGPTETY